MTIEVTPITRSFHYNGIVLPDVPGLSPHDIRDLYSAQYPELLSAEIDAEAVESGRQAFTFRKAVGTKGADAPEEPKPRIAALLARVSPSAVYSKARMMPLSRALRSQAVLARSVAWARFAASAAPQAMGEVDQRVLPTSEMLAPLP